MLQCDSGDGAWEIDMKTLEFRYPFRYAGDDGYVVATCFMKKAFEFATSQDIRL